MSDTYKQIFKVSNTLSLLFVIHRNQMTRNMLVTDIACYIVDLVLSIVQFSEFDTFTRQLCVGRLRQSAISHLAWRGNNDIIP